MTNASEATRFRRDIVAPTIEPIGEGYLPDNVSLTFYFTPHASAEHFDDQGVALLKSSDIVIPELLGWTPSSLRDYNHVSKGDYTRYQKLRASAAAMEYGAYQNALLAALYNSRKPILFAEADHTVKGLTIGDDAYGRAVTGDVESTLDGFADIAAKIAEKSLTRDAIVLANLGPEVTKLVVSHPKLSGKEEVGVMLAYGIVHQELRVPFQTAEVFKDRVRTYFWRDRNEINSEGTLVHRYRSGEAPTRDELAEFFVKFALCTVMMPNIYEHMFFDLESEYRGVKERRDLLGEQMARLVLNMGDEGLELSLQVLKKRISLHVAQSLAAIFHEAVAIAEHEQA